MNKLSKNKISFLTSLSQKKYRNRYKKALIEGIRIIEEALAGEAVIESIIYEIGSGEKFGQLLKKCADKGIEIIQGKASELQRISTLTTSPGICAVIEIPENRFDTKKISNSNNIIAVNNINDPGNLGTIIRTAEWFGIDAVITDPGCCDLYSPKVLKSTMGTVFHIKVYENVDLPDMIKDLKPEGFKIIATSPKGEKLDKIKNDRSKKMIIIGSEAAGINKDLLNLSDIEVKIPGKGKVDSLNAAVSCGIIIWEITKGN